MPFALRARSQLQELLGHLRGRQAAAAVPSASHRFLAEPRLSEGCKLQPRNQRPLSRQQKAGLRTSNAAKVMAMVGACFTSVSPTPLNSAAAAATKEHGQSDALD